MRNDNEIQLTSTEIFKEFGIIPNCNFPPFSFLQIFIICKGEYKTEGATFYF